MTGVTEVLWLGILLGVGAALSVTALVSLVEYDADAETYAVRIGDVALTVPTPRADAKRFSGQREAVISGKLKVYDANQLQLSDSKLTRLP